MSNYNMTMQNIPNSHFCYTYDGKSKSINTDECRSKGVDVNACYTDESEPKSVHKANTRKVKYKEDENFWLWTIKN